MPTKEELILEKIRYQLNTDITEEELLMLEKGYPIQKIMGYVELQNIRINVNHFILIPRYETEEVIEVTKKIIKETNSLNILDLCCGSGFIGLSLKHNFPNINVTMSDISDEAIRQSIENAALNNIKNIRIIKSDLFTNINKQIFDIIISNPPYISFDQILPASVAQFEPLDALYAKKDGFDIIEKIILKAKNYLKPQGYLILEIDPFKVKYLIEIKNISLKIIKDINKKDRIAIIQYI